MKRVIAIFATVAVAAVITVGFVLFTQRQEEITQKQSDLGRLSQESYAGVFVSMYSVSEYNEVDFEYYRGVKTVKANYIVSNLAIVSEYLDAAFATENQITHVYLGIDPVKLWDNCRENINKWNRELQEELLPYLEQNPTLSFEIMLPYQSLEYWTALSVDEREVILNIYTNFIGWMDGYDNVTMYFLGAEQWLIANPGNYAKNSILEPLVAQKLMLLTFCDGEYQISNENVNVIFEELKELITEETESTTEYPDLSQWKLIFWGDSVIGNYVGSLSVPGVVTGLTGASTYNYAIGGTQATDMEGYHVAFPDMVEQIVSGNMGNTRDETSFPYEVLDSEDTPLCFLVHYGLNDYFNGVAVESFTEALQNGVERLKEKYPDSVIILMTPPFCRAFSAGTERNSEVGGVLTEYVAAVEKVAEQQNVLCMNNYLGLGITADNDTEYLADGVHLNEYGRFILGKQIAEILQQEIQ